MNKKATGEILHALVDHVLNCRQRMVQKELYATDQWVIQKKDTILLESKTKVKS